MLNVSAIKKQFPIFQKTPGLVFLDNASTTQKPERVLKAMEIFYLESNANIHRGVYGLAEKADRIYDEARATLAKFVGCASDEIIFTKSATEGTNLLAFGIGEAFVGPGDNVVVTELEHHSNYLPWQEMAKRKGAEFRVVRVKDETGALDEDDLEKLIDERTKVVAVTVKSNVLGVNPDHKISLAAKRKGALVVLDCAQSAAHERTDVAALGADAAVFTGHKLFGPMGTGFIYLKKNLAEKIPPMLTGGGMLKDLPDAWLDSPTKFEAGTPNVAGYAGLAEAVKMFEEIGWQEIIAHEKNLGVLGRKLLAKLPGVKLYGPAHEEQFTSMIAFSVDGVHAHDLASVLAEDEICIRAGHHCAKPLLRSLGVNALARASFSIYNEESDIEKLAAGVEKAIKLFNQ